MAAVSSSCHEDALWIMGKMAYLDNLLRYTNDALVLVDILIREKEDAWCLRCLRLLLQSGQIDAKRAEVEEVLSECEKGEEDR